MNKEIETSLGNKEVFSRNLLRYLGTTDALQKDIAKIVGVSNGTFNDWVKGRCYPRMDKVQKLADYFGINKSDLIEDVNVSEKSISEQDQEILDLFHRVPKDKRAFVLSMIQSAIDNL